MGDVGPDVHQLRNAPAAAVFSQFLEHFSYLEEQHHGDRFGELGLRSGEETYPKGPDGCYTHQEMFVEGFPFKQPFCSFRQNVVAD